jgi:hypothetical protein
VVEETAAAARVARVLLAKAIMAALVPGVARAAVAARILVPVDLAAPELLLLPVTAATELPVEFQEWACSGPVAAGAVELSPAFLLKEPVAWVAVAKAAVTRFSQRRLERQTPAAVVAAGG